MRTAAVFLFVSLALGSGGPLAADPGEGLAETAPIVATVDGVAVSASEYKLIMQREMSAVFARFKLEQSKEDHPGYWADTGKNDTPVAALREATLRTLARIKTELAMAKERDIPVEISFAVLRKELDRENARRAAAIASGAAIYGPRIYSLPVYYDIRFNETAYQLRQTMAREAAPEIPEATLREAYEARKPILGEMTYDEAKSHLQNTLALELAETRINAAVRSARVETNAKILSTIPARSEP